jgi:penicillin-binding protein 1A
MDPRTGRVFALVGGWSFQQSQFDRATQAKRQPGSAFKPFVYVTALENGFTPSSVVDDAPIELSQGPGKPPWQPVNYEGGYVGPTTLEDALIHSRNLVTARLATMIGLPAIAQTVQNFDVMDKMPLYYSMSLGAGETTLLRLTSAYAMLDNGGHWLLPSVIDVVQDRNGRVVYQKGVKDCTACYVDAGARSGAETGASYRASGPPDPAAVALPNGTYAENAVLYEPTKRDPLVSEEADHAILSMMQGVVQRGTGTAVAAVGKPLAGKTGTTSDWFDAWFVGFSPDLAAGVFVGFDEPRTLGNGEVGGHVAAPIFRDFMAQALKDVPAKPFPVPSSAAPLVASVSYSAPYNTGSLATVDQDHPIVDRSAPAVHDYGSNATPASPADRDYATPATPDDARPNWPGSTTPRARGYAAAPVPADAPPPPPWAPNSGASSYGAPSYTAPRIAGYPAPSYGYPAPSYGYAAAPPGYATPPMPQYPVPTRARPGGGTGGLY